ncbi:MAG: 6-pyruvoyl-tetrahydropterin synthase-related protein [Terracidiphilus sp.]|nr:6-pyruvoyl-tetrahydropterin synthase-related protein [Terracidiphilus sp.]
MRPGKPPRWNRFLGPAVILLAAAIAIAPQLVRGNSCGHDFDFHLVSWFDCLHSWQHGILYPHWTPSANYGAGEPRFVFYPPLTWMLGAALGLVLPWPLVPIALTFLLLAGTGLATRALARQTLADAPATLAGCAALFSGYSLFTAYERSAFAELSGGFWIPLILLFILRSRNSSGSLFHRALDGSAVPLVLLVAGAWLSNPPVGVMASYVLAAVALALALLQKSWTPAVRATLAASLGLALSALYLVPAAIQQRWVSVQQITVDPGEMVENSWLFARHADPALALHDVELHRVSCIAVAMLAVALLGILVSWRRGKLRDLRNWWIPLALVPVAVLLLQFPISLPLWNLLPKLRFLQFPWRWLVVLDAPMAIFFSMAVWPARRGPRYIVAAACAAVFLAASVTSGMYFFQPCDDEDAVGPMVDVYRSGAGFVGTDEYTPPGADSSLLATGLPSACLVSDPSTVLGVSAPPDADDTAPLWNSSQHSCEATFATTANQPEHLRLAALIPHPGYLVLRLRSYPAWQVQINGRPVSSLPPRQDGLIAVPVPQGPVNVTVDWTTTSDVLAGRWLSTLAVLALIFLCFFERRFTRPRLS